MLAMFCYAISLFVVVCHGDPNVAMNQPLPFKHSTEFTDESLAGALETAQPLFINFYSVFTGAAKDFVKTWDDVAEALSDSDVIVGHMDIMKNHQSKYQFGIRDVPWLLMLIDGMSYRVDNTGQTLIRDDVKPYVEFALGGYENAEDYSRIRKRKHIPQWFAERDYRNPVDGKLYPGAL